MIVTGCGSSTANGQYTYNGQSNGYPQYLSQETGSTIYNIGGIWILQLNGGAYEGLDTGLATPDLETNWQKTGFAELPGPSMAQTTSFNLPFTFPTGANSQPNTISMIPLSQNYTLLPTGQVVFASAGGGVMGMG
jgi:hypothetical protein